MHRDDIATFWALVFSFLALQESFQAVLFYFPEVANQAYAVVFSVTSVHSIQVAAGHGVTLKTEPNRVFGEFLAASFNEAVLVSWKTP